MIESLEKFACGTYDVAAGALGKLKGLAKNPRFLMLAVILTMATVSVMAQTNGAGDYSAGTKALGDVTAQIALYVPIVQKLCYAIAGVIAIVGAISVYFKMNNEEQDVKKSIMMIVGACIFLIAAAQALPAFFGVSTK